MTSRASVHIEPTGEPKSQRPKIADTIADLDKMLITAEWIEKEFLGARIRQAATIVEEGLDQQKEQKTKKTKNIFFCWRSASAELSEELYELPSGTEALSELTQELSKKLLERLFDHAIYTHKQLEDVAMQAGGGRTTARDPGVQGRSGGHLQVF